MKYAEDEAVFRCSTRNIREEECCSRREQRDIQAITHFISHIKWTSEKREEGGITWLEFYIWYRMHSPRVEIDPLATTKPLLNDITIFKSQVRKVATYCIKEEQEWVLSTCYGRGNRLKNAAIGNKHAAIQGMPEIPKDEAEHILKAILEMKGAQTKKHKLAHEEGRLA